MLRFEKQKTDRERNEQLERTKRNKEENSLRTAMAEADT